MAAASTDYFTKVGTPGTATTLPAPGHTIAGTSFTVVSTSNWPTDTGVIFAIDTLDITTGERVPGSYTEWEGVVASATSITGGVLRYGTDQNYSAGSTTRVYIPVAGSMVNRLMAGILTEHDQDGTHGAVTASTVVASGAITASSFVLSGGAGDSGWSVGLNAPNTVVCNGNRNYTLTFNSVNYSTTLSPGMRGRTTRTVAAPTQCTSLNGTTQYYSKSSPAGMTFTDDFAAGAWVKLSSYTAGAQTIISRFNGTSGWQMTVEATGQIQLAGFNASASNYSLVKSYQSIPLNKWVHVTAQLDMSTFTATTTTSYVMIDGVDVPASVSRAGTNPTALVQAGNLEVGTGSATGFLGGKIAQPFVTSAKLTQANAKLIYSQGITTADTATYSMASAYSFNNSITDLNTTSANNLTANGSAVATNADSPFGTQADGTISSTLDYGIIQSVSYSTNTTVVVQVPEGCTIPTSGGVSAFAYSTQKAPYGMPVQKDKWRITACVGAQLDTGSLAAGAIGNFSLVNINVPVGAFDVGYNVAAQQNPASGANATYVYALSTSSSSFSDIEFARPGSLASGSTVSAFAGQLSQSKAISLSAATPYYIVAKNGLGVGATNYLSVSAYTALSVLFADNSYL